MKSLLLLFCLVGFDGTAEVAANAVQAEQTRPALILRAIIHDNQRHCDYLYELELQHSVPDDVAWIELNKGDYFQKEESGLFWDVKRKCKGYVAPDTSRKFHGSWSSADVLKMDEYFKSLGFQYIGVKQNTYFSITSVKNITGRDLSAERVPDLRESPFY